MKNNNTNKIIKNEILLVLIPHRDARVVMQKYTGSLIKAGIKGVYPFPCAAPLASLSKFLNPEELKHTAHSLRKFMGCNKFYVNGTSAVPVNINNNDMTLWGPKIDIMIPSSVNETGEKIISCYSPLITGSFLIPDKNGQDYFAGLPNNAISPLTGLNLSFRAAAVANMRWKSMSENGEIYFKWKIGRLFWLPKTI